MRIGIANDMPMAVEAMRRALAQEPAHSILWVAQNGAEAVRLCSRERPDLLLMDLIMPVMDGVEAVRRVMADCPCPILIVTSDVDRHMGRIFEAMGHGAVDVVATPALAGGNAAGGAALLRKIDAIGWLIGHGRHRGAPAAAVPAVDAAPLVAIGASAGGPLALEALLRELPRGFPGAVVLVQHVDAVFAAEMAQWLAGSSALPVRLARDGEPPQPGHVLLAGTQDHIRLGGAGTLRYSPEPAEHFYRPSIDIFFDSLADHWAGEAVGVLLTGMGQDGARGLKRMRGRGWLTIAQDRATSAVYGMPKAAAERAAAAEILPLAGIAGRIVQAVMPAAGAAAMTPARPPVTP